MNEMRDPKLSDAYRALGEEEPPGALDAAITSAARRSVGAKPRASGFRRWQAPLAAAAVLVLAVAVALQVEREKPLTELEREKPLTEPPAAPSSAPSATAPAAAPEAAPPPIATANRVQSEPRAESSQARASAADQKESVVEPAVPSSPPAPRAAPPAPAAAEAPALSASQPAAAGAAGASAERRAMMRNADVSRDAAESPEQWLERIARLRTEGRHDEADRALAQFRNRYPEYRLSEAMKARVERADR